MLLDGFQKDTFADSSHKVHIPASLQPYALSHCGRLEALMLSAVCYRLSSILLARETCNNGIT